MDDRDGMSAAIIIDKDDPNIPNIKFYSNRNSKDYRSFSGQQYLEHLKFVGLHIVKLIIAHDGKSLLVVKCGYLDKLYYIFGIFTGDHLIFYTDTGSSASKIKDIADDHIPDSIYHELIWMFGD